MGYYSHILYVMCDMFDSAQKCRLTNYVIQYLKNEYWVKLNSFVVDFYI